MKKLPMIFGALAILFYAMTLSFGIFGILAAMDGESVMRYMIVAFASLVSAIILSIGAQP